MPVPVMKGFLNLDRIPEEKVTDKITRRIVTGEKEMVEHEAWFPEDSEVVDIFSPPREDFYTGEDGYLRKG